IEDLLVNVRMVTPKGVLEKNCQVPRLSCGPDFNHVIMGSEGSFGVITEVTLKIRPLPQCKRYGSIVFPDFESGVKCMRDVAKERCQPASIRLMDNEQFKFGQSLKPVASILSTFVDGLKKFYVTRIKGFDMDSMVVMTLLFEGDKKEVDQNEKKIYAIAEKFGGFPFFFCYPNFVSYLIFRQELLKWNGWGYKDSQFILKDNLLYFTGDRYPIGGHYLPYFTQWVKDVLNVEVTKFQKTKTPPPPQRYPDTNVPKELFDRLNDMNLSYSTDGLDRLIRAHGHTLHDIYILRESSFKRIPDIVIWPSCHDDVVKIVAFACELNMVIIPFGGGTAVSGAIDCPDDPRIIISLDTSQMNNILVLDRENLTVTCESGIIGQDLERELKGFGFTCGHEPDSYEFSSLGGWVATRASGMKKNIYGNIEDLLVNVRMVTPKGVLEKNCQVPRLSCGPDFNHVIMGSEGSFGVITEVTLKIRPLPQCKRYGSIVFPDFESGVKCMRDVAKERCQPASIRLMDNEQFKFGQSLKPVASILSTFVDGLKKFYVTRIKGFDMDSMVVMTLLFEGDKKEVDQNEKKIYAIAEKFGGFPAGGTNGERGYMLTFVIAYIRV
ncbi:hypothetical protein AMK59_1739, partial [Oryctes borbonicus]